MKKALFFFVFLILILACGQEVTDAPPEPTAPTGFTSETEQRLADIFADTMDRRGPAKALALMRDAGVVIPDHLIDTFLDYHEKLCFSLHAPIPEGFSGVFQAEDAAKTLGLSLEQYQSNCYSFWTTEGFIMFITDTKALLQALEGQLGHESGDYLKLVCEFPQTSLLHDATLAVTWDRLGEHMACYFDYIETWPEGIHTEKAKNAFAWSYQLYIGAVRLDNTPFDEGGALIPELRQSYEAFLSSHDDAYLPAQDIRLLRDIWSLKGYRIDNEIYALIHQLAEQYPFIW